MKIKVLQEMANVPKEDTNLPYDIWIDSSGFKRNTSHSKPRLKVGKEHIPVSIENEPRVFGNKSKYDIPKFRLLVKWIRKNLDLLMKHWNREIDDTQLRNSIKKI